VTYWRAIQTPIPLPEVAPTLRSSGEPYMLSPTRLYEAAMISSGGMTNRLDRLEKVALIERRPDPNDRRGKLIALAAPEGASSTRRSRGTLRMRRGAVCAEHRRAEKAGRAAEEADRGVVALVQSSSAARGALREVTAISARQSSRESRDRAAGRSVRNLP
jgi:hypothetical protein